MLAALITLPLTAGVAWGVLELHPATRRFDRGAKELLAAAQRVHRYADPDYQRDALARLDENVLNGPFYRLDDHLESAKSLEGPDLDSAVTSDGVISRFEFDGTDVVPLIPNRDDPTWVFGDESVTLRAADVGRYLSTDRALDLPVSEIGSIIVRARSDEVTSLRMGWSEQVGRDSPRLRPESVENLARWRSFISIDLVGGWEYHTYEINAANAILREMGPDAVLRTLFVHPSDRPVGFVEIDYIRVISKKGKYSLSAQGTGYETISGEMRHALYMLPNQTLEFDVTIPATGPELTFGIGTLFDEAEVVFSVSVVGEAGGDVRVFHRTVRRAAWQDVRVDLADWAGQNIRLLLRVHGAAGNVAFWSNPRVSSTRRTPLNVIIVLEDALRADHLSTYGYGRETAPFKDSLMSGGVVFMNAVSTATKTRSSVPSLFTSLLPSTTGVWHWDHLLADNYLTMAELLRSQGFVTAAFIQNGNAGPWAGAHQGYSVVFNPGSETESILAERIRAWLSANRTSNFFLYLHLMDPHGPYDPPTYPAEWNDGDADGGTPIERVEFHYLDVGPDAPTVEGRNLRYDGEVRHNDEVLRRFTEVLDSLELLENTLLVFTADHGEYLGEYGDWEHHPPGRPPAIRVPLMLYYPVRFAEPRRIIEPVHLVDVMPTVLEVADIATPEIVGHGESLVDLIDGRRSSHWRERLVVSEEPSTWSKRDPCACGSFLTGAWHVLMSDQLRGVPRVRLESRVFDLTTPERHRSSRSALGNYLAWFKAPRVFRELQSINLEAGLRLRGSDVDKALLVDPDVIERLRGLGYIND